MRSQRISFWRIIDTGGVLCQIVLYPLYLIAGVQQLMAGVPNTVYQELGKSASDVWLWSLIIGPTICYGALFLRNQYMSVGLQMCANMLISFALATYVAAIFQATWLDRATFSIYPALGGAILSALIALRDGRRLLRIEKLAQRTDC